MTNSYQLKAINWLLHDGHDVKHSDSEYDALVQSGDCFITLATELDDITRDATLPLATRVRLEQLTKTLLFLQQHYSLRPVATDYHH